MLRFQKVYPSLTEKHSEKHDAIELLLLFQLLKWSLKDLSLWDFSNLEEVLGRSKKMVLGQIDKHLHHSGNSFDFQDQVEEQKLVQQIQKQRRNIAKSLSVNDLHMNTSPLKNQQVIHEAGKQLINDLFYLIANFIVRPHESLLWKKL